LSTTISVRSDEAGTPFRRRRRAAARCTPLEHSGQRDPELDPVELYRRQPGTFGMTPDQIRAYGRYLISQGWQRWEVEATLIDPRALQRRLDDAADSDRIVNPWRHDAYV
jgi:hypothetical protein